MSRFSLRPRADLWPFIDRIWGWENETPQTPLLPGTGAELFFFPGAVPDRPSSARFLLVSPRRRPLDWFGAEKQTFFAVRFRSPALRHFLPQPVGEVCDQVTPAEELWGKNWGTLGERMAEQADLKTSLALWQTELAALLHRYRKSDHLDVPIEDLYYAAPGFSVDKYCRDQQIGRRNFERQILSAVGVPPKTFQKTARLQKIVRRLLLDKSRHYMGEALESGYFDQPHFLHDFKAFTGESPRTFFRQNRFLSHFYNTSR